ncbi:MAG: Gfo/Idh/MocA family oxidoreductase [Planctomycetaceae bacterium]|jgi:myo-inositol 2-dehydrogenase/D-chiro-inositol 1-dehydrogenase|nr:Gfo/Idh/MocA family oxidoreductase [Planctomycetaceae bacterium]
MIRYGIIGFGAWGRCYADAVCKTPDGVPAAAADINKDTVTEIQADFPDIFVTENYRELLNRTDIDAAVVCTPNDLHCSVGLDVLNAGKHLLIEKPFAVTAAECEELIQAAERNNRLLVAGHQFRLSPLWGKIKSLLDAGFAGEPKYVLIELSRNPYRQGADGWRYHQQRVGNWILEEAIHFFDLATWYLQPFGKPVSVYAAASANQPDSILYDNLSATVLFSNGAHAVIAQTLSAFEHHQTVKVAGTKGSLWANWSGVLDRTLTPSFFLRIASRSGDGIHVEEVRFEEPTGEIFELQKQIAVMNAAIQGKAAIHCTGTEARDAVVLSNAAQKSAETGKIVTLLS